MLTVSVVPDYASAIMDAEQDGFKGLNVQEIKSDAVAAALAQQFAVTVRHSASQVFSGKERCASALSRQ